MRPLTRLWTVALVAGLVYSLPAIAGSPQAKAARPTVAILDFDYGSINHWWGGNEDIGKGIADMIVDALVDDGSFRMIERKKINGVLGEQNFNTSDRVDPAAKAAQYGKVLGARYLVYGSITKFGTEDNSKSVGGGAFGGGKFGLGKVGTSSGKASVAITARIIDTTTSEIMVSAKGEGGSKRSGLLLGGAGGGGSGGGGAINFGASNFRDTIIGEATEIAVKDTVAKLLAKKDRLE